MGLNEKFFRSDSDDVPSGAVRFYKFEDNLTDEVGGSTMNVGRGTFEYTTTNKFNCEAVNFNGSDEYANNLGLDFSPGGALHTYSVSAWVRFNGLPTNSVHKLLSNGTNSVGYVFSIRDNGSARQIYGGGSYDNFTSNDFPSINNTSYYHCVVTYDGTGNTVKVYVNNSLSRTYTADADNQLPTNAQLAFGSSAYGSYHIPNCIVDQMRIYSRVLTASEVTSLYDELDSGCTRPLEVFYLLVAGGGGGGNFDGGGGGAGGLLTNFGGTGVSLSLATNYEIRVGNGGAGGQKTSPITTSEVGAHTTSDIVSNLTALGGGGGANDNGNAGGNGGGASNGGSGGGAAGGSNSSKGLGTSGQGFNGGNASGNNGGGGGGAGEVGNTNAQGYGGDGLANAITGTSIFYAGGGGGDSRSVGFPGGSGGGASGSGTQAGGGGNDFGGGGGSSGGATNIPGGRGGSGVAILRYPSAYAIAEVTSSSCSFTTTTDGNDNVTTFIYTGSATVKQQGTMTIQFS